MSGGTIAELQAALDGWVAHYNCERPHQAVGMCPPAERFRIAAAAKVLAAPASDAAESNESDRRIAAESGASRAPGVSRWVDQAGQVSVAGFRYPLGRVFAGEPVEVVVSAGLVEIRPAGVLVATHVQRRRPDGVECQPVTQRRARRPRGGPSVTRVADANGAVSFAGVMYRAGRPWARRSIEVSLVAGSVQSPPTDSSSACTPPATTPPKNTAPSPPRTADPENQSRPRSRSCRTPTGQHPSHGYRNLTGRRVAKTRRTL